MISFDAVQRLEDKAVVRRPTHPASQIRSVAKLLPVHRKADPWIVDSKHSRDRQALSAEEAVEHQFVAEGQPVLNRGEQRPEPAGRPPAVGEIILLIGMRDAGIEQAVLKVRPHAELVVKIEHHQVSGDGSDAHPVLS